MAGTTCPIPPGGNFTYILQVKDQSGTYFYFPSLAFHNAAGGFGAIRVLSRPMIPVPFPPPAADYPLLIGDWYKANHTVRLIPSYPTPIHFLKCVCNLINSETDRDQHLVINCTGLEVHARQRQGPRLPRRPSHQWPELGRLHLQRPTRQVENSHLLNHRVEIQGLISFGTHEFYSIFTGNSSVPMNFLQNPMFQQNFRAENKKCREDAQGPDLERGAVDVAEHPVPGAHDDAGGGGGVPHHADHLLVARRPPRPVLLRAPHRRPAGLRLRRRRLHALHLQEHLHHRRPPLLRLRRQVPRRTPGRPHHPDRLVPQPGPLHQVSDSGVSAAF